MPPICMGAVSLTTSTSTCLSSARCIARRTRGSCSALFFFWLKKTACTTDWLKAAAVTPGISLALRHDTGSMSRA